MASCQALTDEIYASPLWVWFSPRLLWLFWYDCQFWYIWYVFQLLAASTCSDRGLPWQFEYTINQVCSLRFRSEAQLQTLLYSHYRAFPPLYFILCPRQINTGFWARLYIPSRIITRSGRYIAVLLSNSSSSIHWTQLVYQATVFLSRSSISFGLPVLPARLLPLPAIMQTIIFSLLFIESAHGFFPSDWEAISISFVFTLISIEGICGGLA